jgi:hypothetical protein
MEQAITFYKQHEALASQGAQINWEGVAKTMANLLIQQQSAANIVNVN